jgi:hypothetical protein
MNTVSKTVNNSMMNAIPAANADQLGEQTHVPTPASGMTGGWDAFEVWNRFIKEARDRRQVEKRSS